MRVRPQQQVQRLRRSAWAGVGCVRPQSYVEACGGGVRNDAVCQGVVPTVTPPLRQVCRTIASELGGSEVQHQGKQAMRADPAV